MREAVLNTAVRKDPSQETTVKSRLNDDKVHSLKNGGGVSQAEQSLRQEPGQTMEGQQEGQGDCCTVNQG